jgi:hypothetical protein
MNYSLIFGYVSELDKRVLLMWCMHMFCGRTIEREVSTSVRRTISLDQNIRRHISDVCVVVMY